MREKPSFRSSPRPEMGYAPAFVCVPAQMLFGAYLRLPEWFCISLSLRMVLTLLSPPALGLFSRARTWESKYEIGKGHGGEKDRKCCSPGNPSFICLLPFYLSPFPSSLLPTLYSHFLVHGSVLSRASPQSFPDAVKHAWLVSRSVHPKLNQPNGFFL